MIAGQTAPPMIAMTSRGRSQLRVRSKVLQAQRENCRKHDGMKKADQNDGPDRRDARSEQNDQKTEQRAAGKQAEQAGRRDFLHDGGAGKTSDHEASQVRLQVVSGRFFVSAGQGELGESDDEAGYANLRAYVEELGDHALDQMPKGKGAAQLRFRGVEAFNAGSRGSPAVSSGR